MQEEQVQPPNEVPAEVTQAAQVLAKKHIDGSGWFYWIAGLSLINSAVILSGSDWSFLIGLGATQIVDYFSLGATEGIEASSRTIVLAIAFIIDVIIAGTFFLWGFFSRKGYRWAYIIGIVLYSLDGLIFLAFQDWPSLGFHIFALYFIIGGFKAFGQLQQLIVQHPSLVGN